MPSDQLPRRPSVPIAARASHKLPLPEALSQRDPDYGTMSGNSNCLLFLMCNSISRSMVRQTT